MTTRIAYASTATAGLADRAALRPIPRRAMMAAEREVEVSRWDRES